MVFLNNIFFGNGDRNAIGIANTARCIFANNLSYETSDSFAGGNANQYGSANAANLNNLNPRFSSFRDDYRELERMMQSNFVLATDSPAKGKGVNGTDIGILGGKYPFRHRNRYAHPHVSLITIQNPVVGQSTTIGVEIEATYPQN